jgi:lipopolysaccharide export system protein LptA
MSQPFKRWEWSLLIGLMVLYCTAVAAESRQRTVLNQGTDKAIIIESNSLEIDNKQNIISFIGDVDARQNTLSIQCQKMFIYYKTLSDPNGQDKRDLLEIDKIIAMNGVIVHHPDGLAMAEKAIYYQKDEKVVLTGKPRLQQGDHIAEGSVITFYLNEDRTVVEGFQNSKAGVLPSAEKGNPVGP